MNRGRHKNRNAYMRRVISNLFQNLNLETTSDKRDYVIEIQGLDKWMSRIFSYTYSASQAYTIVHIVSRYLKVHDEINYLRCSVIQINSYQSSSKTIKIK